MSAHFRRRSRIAGVMIACLTVLLAVSAGHAATVLPGLIGGDLTDPENDGTLDGQNYNATFTSNDTASFDNANNDQAAFSSFDNSVGVGTVKWCCSGPASKPGDFLHLTAEFSQRYQLTHFTITSANDSPYRDPTVFRIQGSDDGTSWTDIFVQDDINNSLWADDQRNTTLKFEAGTDYALPGYYRFFRYRVEHTGSTDTVNQDTQHQIAEIEYFGTAAIPAPATLTGGLVLLGGVIMSYGRKRRA